jgi:hypothetical protein
VLYVAWYALFGRAAGSQAPEASLPEMAEFTARGLAHLWAEALRVPTVGGGVVLLALASLSVLLPAPARTRRLAVGGVASCVVLYAVLATSRAGLGTGAALVSRYAYFGVLMTLPAFALVLDAFGRRLRVRSGARWPGAVFLTALVLASAVNGSTQTIAFASDRAALDPDLEAKVVGALALAGEGAPLLTRSVDPSFNPDITVDALLAARADGHLPDTRATPRDVLAAQTALQVAAATRPLGLAQASGVVLHGVQGEVPASGCAAGRAGDGAWLTLPPGQELGIETRRKALRARLLDAGLPGPEVTFTAADGAPTYLANGSPAVLRIEVKPGFVSLCNG